MTTKTLEQEAREAAEAYWLQDQERTDDDARGYEAGYIAAATARNKEIEELRAELADWHESAERAAGESCGDEQHCTCVGALRARVKELEGMKPCPCAECGGIGAVETYRAEHAPGCTDTRCMPSCPQPVQVMVPCDHCGGNGAIMVPPIPLPEGKP